MDHLEGFDSFLKNVDTISELVRDLSSSDLRLQQRAMERADCHIAALTEPCKTKVNHASINTNPPVHPGLNLNHGSPEAFMKMMEKDAEDRRKLKISKQKKATALKDKGNKAYVQEDYETAVKYYSDGLAELKDMEELYTNRAQANIKLGKFIEAISDCEWALKCNEKCAKAYLHMGKACMALKKYDDSRNCFEKIEEIDPGRGKIVKEYLTKVDFEEKKENQEMKARQDFDEGVGTTKTVPQLLEKLSRPSQMSVYYCGGLELLSQAVTDCTGQTLFRLNNGFSIISDNDMMRSCLLQETKDPRSQELCTSVLKLWRVICCGNDENQRILITCPVSRQSIVNLVSSEHVAVRRECQAILRLYSQSPHGRRLAVDNLDVHMLMKNLMVCISRPTQWENTAVSLLEDFAAEKKFAIQLRDLLTDSFIVPFTTTLRNISKSNRHVIPSLVSVVGRLSQDDVNRASLAHAPECWEAFLVAIKQCSMCDYREITYSLLGLIINISAITSSVIQEYALSLSQCCLDLLKNNDRDIITRATGVLSNVLAQSAEATDYTIQGRVVQTMHQLLKGTDQATIKYALKTLTLCTAASHLAREELVMCDNKLFILCKLLGSSHDETVVGNAALCVSHCLELNGLASNLLGTDIVLLLLRHAASDAKKTAVQQNAAIALGKLCRLEKRHVNRLRELHGFEILHSCMKFIK